MNFERPSRDPADALAALASGGYAGGDATKEITEKLAGLNRARRDEGKPALWPEVRAGAQYRLWKKSGAPDLLSVLFEGDNPFVSICELH